MKFQICLLFALVAFACSIPVPEEEAAIKTSLPAADESSKPEEKKIEDNLPAVAAADAVIPSAKSAEPKEDAAPELKKDEPATKVEAEKPNESAPLAAERKLDIVVAEPAKTVVESAVAAESVVPLASSSQDAVVVLPEVRSALPEEKSLNNNDEEKPAANLKIDEPKSESDITVAPALEKSEPLPIAAAAVAPEPKDLPAAVAAAAVAPSVAAEKSIKPEAELKPEEKKDDKPAPAENESKVEERQTRGDDKIIAEDIAAAPATAELKKEEAPAAAATPAKEENLEKTNELKTELRELLPSVAEAAKPEEKKISEPAVAAAAVAPSTEEKKINENNSSSESKESSESSEEKTA